jgi:uncharacterized protein with NRDE domain
LNGDAGTLPEKLFDMLSDRSVATDRELPDTGVGLQREKALGPKFIAADDRYGTRASTVIIVGRDGRVHYIERSFGPRGTFLSEVSNRFELAAPLTA